MIIKMALKELEIRKELYTFILLQLIITFLIAVSFISMMETEYTKYKAFENYLKKEGWYIYGGNILTPDNYVVNAPAMLEGYLASSDILACYTLSGDLQKEEMPIQAKTIVYDQPIIDAYKPDIKEGRWLKNADIGTNTVEAVIASNSYGIGLGDTLTIHEYGAASEESPVSVEIVGILADDAEYYDISFSDNMINYKNLFASVSKGKQDEPVLLMSREDIINTENGSELLLMQGTVLLTWKEGITDEEKKRNIKYMSEHCFIAQKEELSVVIQKSRKEITGELQKYVPVLACGLLLTVISSLCVGVIVSKQQWKYLAVYNMLGLPWNRCVWIQTVTYIIIEGISLIASILIICILKLFSLTDNMAIGFGAWQFIFCIGISLICAATVIVQSLLVKKVPPYRLWQRE